MMCKQTKASYQNKIERPSRNRDMTKNHQKIRENPQGQKGIRFRLNPMMAFIVILAAAGAIILAALFLFWR